MNIDQVDTAGWLRRGATALAVGRMGLGVVALTSPVAVGRPWAGPSADSQAGRVLGRATGARGKFESDSTSGTQAGAALAKRPTHESGVPTATVATLKRR